MCSRMNASGVAVSYKDKSRLVVLPGDPTSGTARASIVVNWLGHIREENPSCESLPMCSVNSITEMFHHNQVFRFPRPVAFLGRMRIIEGEDVPTGVGMFLQTEDTTVGGIPDRFPSLAGGIKWEEFQVERAEDGALVLS